VVDELSALQERLAQALRHNRALEKDPAWRELADRELCGSSRLSPVEQLEIYREQFWLRHTGSLVEDFPGLGGILGQQDWERLAQQYLTETVPDSYTLRDLGLRLPKLIERADWLPHQALCLDMARLEVAYIEVFDAPDTEPLAPEQLGRIPEEQLGDCRLVVAPCVRLLSVQYPVADLRRQLRANDENHDSDEAVPIPGKNPQNLVVYRKSLRLWDMPLSDVAFAFLTGLGAGSSLGAAAERAASSAEKEAELGAGIGEWLREWTAKGLLCDVVLP
jgi:hypothetical protein